MDDRQVLEIVRRRTAEVLPGVRPADVTPDGRLADLGANSIDRMEIVALSMEDLDVTIPTPEFAAVSDVRSLVDLLTRYAG